MNLGPKERLQWIDTALTSEPNNKFLLIWKAEAHFLLDETLQGVISANKLLKLLDKKSNIYELVFRMANSRYFC